jgi:hypothetical protein
MSEEEEETRQLALALQQKLAANLRPPAFGMLAERIQRGVEAHPKFELDMKTSPRFEVTSAGWTARVRVLRLGTLGMKRRFREIYGQGPTADLAVSSLVEGLDEWAEVLK